MRPTVRLSAVAATLAVAAVPSVVAVAKSGKDPAPLAVVSVSPSAGRPFTTAVTNATGGLVPLRADLRRMRAAGASFVRVDVNWAQTAPEQRSAGFDAADPGAPEYRWADADAAIRTAVAGHLTPIVDVLGAPAWAQKPPAATWLTQHDPDPAALGAFMTALARRYDGRHGSLPRVRYWAAMNEPNLDQYLLPQFEQGKAVSPLLYRRLVNAFARAVHAVDPGSIVVVGGLTPFTFKDKGVQLSVAPMQFMRQFLCLSAGDHPRPTCPGRVEFDVWAHHPYTSGGPTHKAFNPGDVSLGDLGQMDDLLATAYETGRIAARKPPRFWVTEFSWDSAPPDPKGVPADLEARWVAEAAYQAWTSGVSLFTWYAIQDQPFPDSPFQSGLYFLDGTAKPALQAFRFPLVAYRDGQKANVWLRTPFGRRATVTLEALADGAWTTLGRLQTDGYGIVSAVVRVSGADALRARLRSGELSPAFALIPPDNENLPATPFGTS